jgi:hypothetical protein
MAIATILKAAVWSNATTFNRFYNKPLQTQTNFGQTILDATLSNA